MSIFKKLKKKLKRSNLVYPLSLSASKLLPLLLCLVFTCRAQEPKKIRFAKDRQYIYFFQVGTKSDTLKQAEDYRFYFLVPDSLKRFIVLQSENANFVLTANDSVVRCNYVPGIRYETFYLQVAGDLGNNPVADNLEKGLNFQFKPKAEKLVLRCGANGAAVVVPKRIQIDIVDKRNEQILLQNVFFVP